jgi:Ca-activated chloride channel family protein
VFKSVVLTATAAAILISAIASNAQSPLPTPQLKPAADDEVIKVSTDLVTTPVSVLDRDGRFIAGLKKKDFQIFEDGVPQEITYFQTEETPFTVILMIDISPSTKYRMDEIHYAAVTFVNQLRPADKVMVVAFDQKVRLLTPEPTGDKQAIFAAIYKATFGSGTSLYEAVSAVSDIDAMRVAGRKAVVLFTDGVDTTSKTATYDSTLAASEESDALIYPIRYNTENMGVVSTSSGQPVALPDDIAAMMRQRGIAIDPRLTAGNGAKGTAPADYARGKAYLEKLAENSGGRIFEASSNDNLQQSFASVAEELRRQYSIGYYPSKEGQPGDHRSVKIKVNIPKAVVRAKSGYVIKRMTSRKPVRSNDKLLAMR